MAKEKLSRKELLKRPDEFVTFSGKALESIKAHPQPLRYAGVVIAVIVAAYVVFYAWNRSINREGQSAYNTAEQSLETMSSKPELDPAALKKSGELLEDVIDNYGMSKVARLALPQAAHVNFLEKNYSEAITLYEKFLEDISGDEAYEFLTNLSLAACHEAKGDLKTAIETLTPLVEMPSDIPFKESAMWNLARLYGLDNRPEEEKTVLKEFVEKYEGSPFHAMAKAKLDSLAQ